ncbi:MAG: LEPR-XLL domain-containing protein [Planctomycetes bacterium]|nr:LEPR-XLL domain-containing protein [Planctomycetota bacterium]
MKRAVRRSRTPSPCAHLEALERRVLLSGTTYVVDSLLDVVVDEGLLTLREAIEAANTNAAVCDAPAGSATETDIITFDPVAIPAGAGVALTITLDGAALAIADDLRIEGPGRDVLTVDADGRSRVLAVAPGARAEITGLTLTGGAGVREGGGIYNRGTLTLTNVTVCGNAVAPLGPGWLVLGGGLSNLGTLTAIGSTFAGNASTDYGGGLANWGAMTLVDTVISGNASARSAGIVQVEGELEMARCLVVGNHADRKGGGVHLSGGIGRIVNTVIAANRAGGGGLDEGGGLSAAHATVTVTNCTIAGNYAGGGAGIASTSGNAIVLHNTIVAFNVAHSGGEIEGAVSIRGSLLFCDPGFIRPPSAGPDGTWGTADDDAGDLRLAATSVAINTADDALAVDADGQPLATDAAGNPRTADGRTDVGAYEHQGPPAAAREPLSTVVTTGDDTVDITDGRTSLREACLAAMLLGGDVTFASDLDGGTIALAGGALRLYQPVTIDAMSSGGVTIVGGQDNVISVGTGARVDLLGLTLTGGSGTWGGGIANSGTLTLTGCTVSDNAAWCGGGIYNHGTLVLDRSTVSDNRLTEGPYAGYDTYGAGICNWGGTVLLTGSRVLRNATSPEWAEGGGIYNTGGAVTVSNSVIASNRASGYGGGVCSADTFGDKPVVTLINCTVAANGSEDDRAGIMNIRGTLALANTIVAFNTIETSHGQISGSSTESHCLIGDAPLFVRDPSIGPDGVWGTSDDDPGDLRLRPGSAAIDAGDTALAVDAEGSPLAYDVAGGIRVQGARVDIGACEFPRVSGDANDDGAVDLDDFALLKSHFGASPAAWAIGDFDGSGTVDLDDFVILKQNFGAAAAPAGHADALLARVDQPVSRVHRLRRIRRTRTSPEATAVDLLALAAVPLL